MNPKFSNLGVMIVAMAAVSIAEKIASIIKVGMAGYPPPRPLVSYEKPETTEPTDEESS